MKRPPARDLAIAAIFGVSYPLLYEFLPYEWQVGGLPFHGEAVLLAIAIAFGTPATLGLVGGTVIVRAAGVDGLPWSYGAAEALTLAVGLLAAQWVWRRAGEGSKALAAPAVLSALVTLGLGSYWTLETGRPEYGALLLQSFLAVNVVGSLLLLLGGSLWQASRGTHSPARTP